MLIVNFSANLAFLTSEKISVKLDTLGMAGYIRVEYRESVNATY